MKKNKNLILGLTLFCCIPLIGNSQDLMHLADSAQGLVITPLPFPSTWKDTRLVNAQTTKTVAPQAMVFRISHRFGNVGGEDGGGVHTLYGFDVASDIYMSFEFGILKNLEVGCGRSKAQELLDVFAKYRPLTQNASGMPISLALYGDAAITPELNAVFYDGADPAITPYNNVDRLSYLGETIVDRRFGDICSAELYGGIDHRNFILGLVNATNNAVDKNNIGFVGAGGRICLTKHASVVFDYYYIVSAFRTNNVNQPYYNVFALGYEIETGGHTFRINLSNNSFINEVNFIPNTTDNWFQGGFKLGFSISRLFNI